MRIAIVVLAMAFIGCGGNLPIPVPNQLPYSDPRVGFDFVAEGCDKVGRFESMGVPVNWFSVCRDSAVTVLAACEIEANFGSVEVSIIVFNERADSIHVVPSAVRVLTGSGEKVLFDRSVGGQILRGSKGLVVVSDTLLVLPADSLHLKMISPTVADSVNRYNIAMSDYSTLQFILGSLIPEKAHACKGKTPVTFVLQAGEGSKGR